MMKHFSVKVVKANGSVDYYSVLAEDEDAAIEKVKKIPIDVTTRWFGEGFKVVAAFDDSKWTIKPINFYPKEKKEKRGHGTTENTLTETEERENTKAANEFLAGKGVNVPFDYDGISIDYDGYERGNE